MKDVFAIIVTYNGMKWIEECLQSLLDSTLKTSIIVVDNNSRDNTASFIKEKYKEDVFLIESKENLGFGKGNNLGLSYALKNGADYVFLLNQDAFVESDTIEKLINLANNNPDYGIVSPIQTNGNGTMLDKSFFYYISKTFNSRFTSDFILNNSKETIYDIPMINAAAWLLPRSTIEVVGGFDPMFFLYGEDDNYCQRVIFNNLKIGIASDVFIRHDSLNNNSAEIIVGSKKYFDIFLNQTKVIFGNVNNDNYKNLSKQRLNILKKSVKSLLNLNYLEFKVNLKKWKLMRNLGIEKSVLLNRQNGVKYI